MKALSSVEIHYLLKEINFLIGAKTDKIYNPGEKEVLLQLHVPNIGKKILRITDKALYLTEAKEEHKEPTGFCMVLRKNLDNTRLKEINQLNSERIVEFVFETKEGIKKLIAELFGGGNIILCDKENKIISALGFHKFKDREIKKEMIYTYPEKQINFFDINLDNFRKLIKETNKELLVKALAIDIGLGGTYAEEVCLSAEIDKNKDPKKLNDDEIASIIKSIKKIINKKIEPQIIYENNEIKDVVPISLEIYKNNNKKDFKTYSEALDFYFSNITVKKTSYDKSIEKISRIIEKQKEKIKELNKEEKENREKAEIIYQKYQLINEILTEINKAKEKYSWEEIKNKLKGHKVIKEVNLKDKEITVEV